MLAVAALVCFVLALAFGAMVPAVPTSRRR